MLRSDFMEAKKDIDSLYDQHFIIWNSTLGVRDFVLIEKIEDSNSGFQAWLDEPYEMVGPFNLDELLQKGKIDFAECQVVSKEFWRENRLKILNDSYKQQQKFRQKMDEELTQRNKIRQNNFNDSEESSYRQTLLLPQEIPLTRLQIKAAFKKASKKEHPDVGGSHEKFVQINKAKDALLALYT
jgi:hypothetical protein